MFGQSIIDNKRRKPNSFFNLCIFLLGDYIAFFAIKRVVKNAFEKEDYRGIC